MRYVALLLVIVILCAALSGCAGVFAPVVPPTGMLFTQISAPIDTDMEETTLGSKQGKASTACVLGLVAFGDGSVYTAARDGNISRIDHVDYSFLNVLYLFSMYTTIVYGE